MATKKTKRARPGRNRLIGQKPRRAVEREYLAVLADAVPLAEWQAVVDRALADAKTGDADAREWLSRYLLGDSPASLLKLAAKEQAGIDADADVKHNADEESENAATDEMFRN